jgi:3-phytase
LTCPTSGCSSRRSSRRGHTSRSTRRRAREGIILYACGDTAGYWVTTDQDLTVNTFHVFDRATLRHVGSFRGDSTLNTDGIALTQRGFGTFPSGAFYAVHNDGNVAAFSWAAIADALRLRKDCDFPAGAAEPAS